MSGTLPNIGADVILEFQQSINNITLFGQAMEGLDNKFGTMERRIDGMRASLSALSAQTSRGTATNLRTEMERELNNLISSNGVVLSKVGTSALKVDANTMRGVFTKINTAINAQLANSYQNIMIQVDPSMQVGKVPIDKTDMDSVNKAIARLVRVQLNNLVAALHKHGSGMISAQDLSSIQFHIGKGTVQQIINKVRDHLKAILLNPQLGTGASFQMTDRDLDRVFNAIKGKVKTSIDDAVMKINAKNQTIIPTADVNKIYNAVNNSAKNYISEVTRGINSVGAASMTKPFSQLSTQIKRQMAKDLNTDLASFNNAFKNSTFSTGDIHAAEIRRQFSRLEQALNRKIGGGLQTEVKEMVKQIESVQINYSPKLRYHLVQQIGRINNQIVKKIREQIDLQFANMRAEINSVAVSPKDINRSRRVRDMGRLDYSGANQANQAMPISRPLANDPYARRDNYMNGFGLQGAITNTLRHILAGSLVGAPMMLLYQSMEQFKTSQLEQLKMFSNFFSKSLADSSERAATGDTRDAQQVAEDNIANILPFVMQASQAYGISYGKMSQVASVGTRLLNDPAEVKAFTDVVSKIYNIDREGDPVANVAPGLEAFMGQFDLAVGELETRVAMPMAVATNLTNATTEAIINAIARSGSMFRAAGVSPEEAIAMTATSIKYTGLSGENIGNFYKSVLPRLQSDSSLKQLENIGVDVYNVGEDGVKRAKSASDIFAEVGSKYEKLSDPDARQVIQKIFGTYQGSKGATTLDEFEEVGKMMKAMESFTPDNFAQLMQANNQTPIIEMQRSFVSVNNALISTFEELTPEITSLAKGITNLAGGIEDNKEALANFISTLGSLLIGLAAVYGARKLGSAAGVPMAIANTRTADSVLGNRSYVKGWSVTSTLREGLAGNSNVAAGALANNSINRQIINGALASPVVAPVIQSMANMTKQQAQAMNSYIKDNNIRVKGIKDVVIAAEQSKDYVGRRQLTPTERWGQSGYNAARLHGTGMIGIDQNFANKLTSDLQDRGKFDALSKTKQGMKVTNFLAGLDENEMKRFQTHLEEMRKKTGRVVNNMGSLTHAINTYAGAQAVARTEAIRANPQLSALGANMDRITTAVNSTALQRGMRNMNSFMGGMSSMARGTATAFGGLGRTIGRFGAQMILFAGIGEAIKNASSGGIYSTEEINLVDNQKNIQDINEYKNFVRQGSGKAHLTAAGATLKTLWEGVFGIGKDTTTDMNDLSGVGIDFAKFLNENKGANISTKDSLTEDSDMATRKRIKDFVESNEMDVDAIFTEYMNWGNGDKSAQQKLKESARADYIKKMEKLALDNQEKAVLDEGINQKEAERRRKEMAEGTYASFSLDEIKKEAETQTGKLNLKTTLDQLEVINKGYATDSEEYLAIRRKQAKDIIDIYQGFLTNIDTTIASLKTKLADLKANGGSAEEIRDTESNLARWQNNKETADAEFKPVIKQQELDSANADFEGVMSSISRAAAMAESGLTLQDAINQVTMDRNSKEFSDSSVGIARSRIADLQTQVESLQGTPTVNKDGSVNADQKNQVDAQVAQLKASIEQERVKIRDLRLTSIGLYKQDLQDSLSQMSNDYLQARVSAGGMDDSSPFMKNIRIGQYEEQIGMFDSVIADLKNQLAGTNDVEQQKGIQREIRDLQRQSLTAQLGILDEMKNTGGTFNLPDNVKAMSYYEYVTRNNSHSTYTVQGGDTNVTVTLPNITDATSAERIKEIGKAFGEGIQSGKSLRLQKQANPFGYRN